jgi:ABC-type antimicrobial peptide transport system permease subunit
MSCYVSQQMHDFGVRLALGARAWDIALVVLSRVALVSALGVAAGGLLLTAVRPYLDVVIAGSRGIEPGFAAIAAVTLPVLVLAAALRPAVRAMRADPLVALRQQ